MPLIICRKCKKIVTSAAEPCPYCGEAKPGEKPADPDPQQGNMRNAVIVFCVLFLLIVFLFQWVSKKDMSRANGESGAPGRPSCLATGCTTGTKAVTYTTQQEPFYLCKSSELSEYANFVLDLMIKKARYADIPPEISVKTGEPAVQGDDRLLLDRYRAKAGISSFEEAISKCYRGVSNLNVVVLFSPDDSNSIYVAAEGSQDDKFWLPKARLYGK